MEDPSRAPGPREQFTGFVSWLAFGCHVLETSIAVFLRRGFGRRYFGLQALAVIPLLLIWATLWPESDSTPLLVFLGAYVMGCVVAQAESFRRQRQGEVQHSFYSGAPCVMHWPILRRGFSERAAKGVIEPVMVLIASWFVAQVDEPLGTYLMVAAVGTMLSIGLGRAAEERRLMDMRDAHIEQQNVAERFRNGNRR
jgi:hypothetical protein